MIINSISNTELTFYKCNDFIAETDSGAQITNKAVFLMKSNLNNSYFSDNKVINKVTVSFNVSTIANKSSRLYCYYGDTDYIGSDITYNDLSNKSIIDFAKIDKSVTNISFNVTDIYSKWDRNSIENFGVYFGNNSTNKYTLSNPTITIEYTSCGYDDINQTYHSVDLGNAGQVIINDYTNTLTLNQNLAGIELNLMGVDLTKYLTSSNKNINTSCRPNSTLNYNGSVKLYNN